MWNRLNKSMMFCQMVFGLSFYGVLVVLTRFFMEDLQYNEADTMMIVGAFSAIGPLFAVAGGLFVDKFLGAKRVLTFSYISYAFGYALLVFSASIKSVTLSLVALALASYARGLMSPSYPSLYKRTFKSQEDFENCYPVNYSVNNVGALLGQYLYPLFVLGIGYSGGFALSGVLAVLAVGVLVVFNKPLVAVGENIDKEPVPFTRMAIFVVMTIGMLGMVFFMFSDMNTGQYVVYVISAAAVLYFFAQMFKVTRSEALRMGTILIMGVLTIAFFVYYGQMITSMTMVTINTMRGELLGFIPLAPEASIALNPLWCIVAGPALTAIFTLLEQHGISWSTATKTSISFILAAVAFGILTLAVKGIGEDVITSPNVFLVIHGLLAFGEVIIGSLVVAFILSVAPLHLEGFSVSLFYIAMALSGVMGTVISGAVAMEKGQEVTQQFVQNVYGDYFGMLTIAAIIMVVVALMASVVVRKMLATADSYENDSKSA